MINNINNKIYGKILGLAMLLLSSPYAYGMDGSLDDTMPILYREESFNLFYDNGLPEDQNRYLQQEAPQQEYGIQEQEKKEENERDMVGNMKGMLCPFPDCGRICAWKSDYDRHIRSHTKEKPYICKTCNSRFSDNSNLRCHIRNQHPEQKPLSCKLCGKKFRWAKNRIVHAQKHRAILAQKQDTYECSQCHKLFKSKVGFGKHVLAHTERSFACSQCDTIFKSKTGLGNHMRIHAECDTCGKTFTYKGSFKSHILQCSKQKFL